MPRPEPDISRYMARFLAMLDTAFVDNGAKDGMPPDLREAVRATPRHNFVHRFRVGGGALLDIDDEAEHHLDTIYSDQVMRHVDAGGAALPSSNSQPSYVLWLLHMLDLRPGQRVLEIGSGSGWLAAVMGHLVGEQGHVTGIEIIPELAEQSRRDLGLAGRRNVTVLAQDGTSGHAAGAPFDRVMITAATWDFPAALFEQVTQDGYVLVPIELRATGDCQVTLLRRSSTGFVAHRSIPGWFVPLTGGGQTRAGMRYVLDKMPQVASAPTIRCKLPLGDAVADFCAFLGRTEPGFAVFETGPAGAADARAVPGAFGLVDDPARAMAMCAAGMLIGYGGDGPARRLARAFARWTNLGLPANGDYHVEVCRVAAAPARAAARGVAPRGAPAVVGSLLPGAIAWRSLLDDAPASQGARVTPLVHPSSSPVQALDSG